MTSKNINSNALISNYKYITDNNGIKYYTILDAINLCKDLSKDKKFVPSMEINVKLGIDPRHSDQNLRFMGKIVHGTGRTPPKIAVISSSAEDIAIAKKLGAYKADGVDLLDSIQKGEIDFDVLITTPKSMHLVARLGKVLGQKGLMPSPKLGTVNANIAQAIDDARNKIEIRADKLGIVRGAVGKVSFETEKLQENIIELIKEIIAKKPAASKGKYLRDIYLSFTMGPAFRIDLNDIKNIKG